MGLYDFFDYTCPHCNKPAHVQTKLGECEMKRLTVGTKMFLGNVRFKLKEACFECGKFAVVVIEDNTIKKFVKPNFDFEETLFGGTRDIDSRPELGEILDT